MADSEVEFISETKVTPEEVKEAAKLGLPSKFMAYRQLPDCQCEQCKRDDENNETSKPIFGFGDAFAKYAESPVRPVFGANSTKPADAKSKNLKEEDAAVYDTNNDLTFASLAAKFSTESPPAFVKDKKEKTTTPFASLGAGTPVFSSRGSDSKNRSKSEDTPEGAGAKVVSTGEEDEEVLFNKRAELFRYDVDNKEWKERGVGQMKILHHPVNKTYRFLLRREKVHKVVLNQLIIPDLNLQPMKTTDKAWLWAGYNYTDDESALEKLAVKFKNCELAQSFGKIVQDVISKVKIQSEKPESKTGWEIGCGGAKAVEHLSREIDLMKLIPSSIQNFDDDDEKNDDIYIFN